MVSRTREQFTAWKSALATLSPQNFRGAPGGWSSLGRDHQEAPGVERTHAWRLETSGKSKSSHPEDWGAEVGRLNSGRGKEADLPDPQCWPDACRGQTPSPFREGPRAFLADKLQSECQVRLHNLKWDLPSWLLGSQHFVLILRTLPELNR